VGFGMLAGAGLAIPKMRRETALVARHPAEPWLCKEDWACGQIASSTKARMTGAIIFAVLWNAMSTPLWFVSPGDVVGNVKLVTLFRLGFCGVGVGLVCWAIAEISRWRKYGQSVFQMASVPGVIGGQLAGVIRTSAKVRPDHGFRLTLSCTHVHGDSRSTVWQDEQLVARELLERDRDRSAIPVVFQIPYSSPETGGNDQTIWKLEATAAVPGVDYRASFEVPVFKTPESDPSFVPDRSAIANYEVAADPAKELAEAGVLKAVSPSGDGHRFEFPMCRHFGTCVFFAAFWGIWSGVIALMLRFGAPILFPIVFGLFDALILAIVVDAWFYRSVADVSGQGLTVRGGLFGLGRARWVEASEVAAIEAAKGMQSGGNVYYNVILVCKDGRRITIGKRLLGNRLATAVIRQIEEAMGRQPNSISSGNSDAPTEPHTQSA
jgi:hypothetical protein